MLIVLIVSLVVLIIVALSDLLGPLINLLIEKRKVRLIFALLFGRTISKNFKLKRLLTPPIALLRYC